MAEPRKKIVIPQDEEMYHTLVRLFIESSEGLRRDFTCMAGSTTYSTVKRVRKHLTNQKKILKEMNEALKYKSKMIKDARWGGEVPARYYRQSKKKKAESEPMIL